MLIMLLTLDSADDDADGGGSDPDGGGGDADLGDIDAEGEGIATGNGV